jgi:hypothetical protein
MNRFKLTNTDKARVQLRRHELDIRIETLTSNIYRHEFDPDFRRSVINWRRELMDAKLERAGSGLQSTCRSLFLFLLLCMLLPPAAHAQIQLGRTWTCALVGIGATLTECQAAPGVAAGTVAGERYIITDVIVQTTTGTAGTYAIRSGTGSNCAGATAQVFPSSGSGADRFSAPINTQPTAVISLRTPLVVLVDHAICLIGIGTNTINVQMIGFITR